MTIQIISMLWAASNLITFAAFSSDKRRAIKTQRRIPEARLLWLCLGGGVGAMIASALMRHKTRKQPFRTYAVCLSALHTACSLAILYLIV